MARKKKHLKFVVHVPNVEGVSVEDFREYIRDAVMSWCGQAQAPQGDDNPDAWWLMVISDKMDDVVVKPHYPRRRNTTVKRAQLPMAIRKQVGLEP